MQTILRLLCVVLAQVAAKLYQVHDADGVTQVQVSGNKCVCMFGWRDSRVTTGRVRTKPRTEQERLCDAELLITSRGATSNVLFSFGSLCEETFVINTIVNTIGV